MRPAWKDGLDTDTKHHRHHCKKRRQKKSHRTHCHDDENWTTGPEDGEPQSRKHFEAEDCQQLNVVDAETVDSADAASSGTVPRFKSRDGVSVAKKVSALNDYLAVLDDRMLGLENHLAHMEQTTQQSLQGIEALLRANLENK